VADPVAIARDALIQRVLEEIPDAELTGHPVDRLPGHASFVFPRVNGETLLLELDRMGYACSSGSACAAGSQEPSPVLVAMGVAPQVAHTAVRLSFNRGTSHENLTAAAEALSAAHKKIAR
jgi:cysteine desulfurase